MGLAETDTVEGRPLTRNKKVYICLIAAYMPLIAMLAASPLRAADGPATSSLLTPAGSQGKVSVVWVDRRTGKLVRGVTGDAPKTAAPARVSPPPQRINDLVEQAAKAHGVDPLLVHSVIQVESNYNLQAVSSKGAEGLMQLMPRTSGMLGVGNTFDPAQNIEAGVRYLRQLQEIYKDDRLALAAYNAGPGAVDRYRQVPPYSETQNYVTRVSERYRAAKAQQRQAQQQSEAAQKAAEAAPGPATATPPEEKHPKLEQFVDSNGRLVLKTASE